MLNTPAVLFLVAIVLTVGVQCGPSDPEPQPEDWWLERHNAFKANTANNPNIPIIFYGDSITEGWGANGRGGPGEPVFNQYYTPLSAANYGIGGDRTQHLLYRILNGEITGLNPKLIVLSIGTNNLGSNPNDEIAGGVRTIVETFRRLLPNTKILVLGIFPRDGEWLYEQILDVNGQLRNLHNGSTVFYFDMFGTFSESWGGVPAELFYDGLHLNTAGYQKWADTMNPLFNILRL